MHLSGGRYTIILSAILGLLASIFFLFVVEEEQKVEVERVFDIDIAWVVALEVNAYDTSTTIEKVPLTGWEITSPMRYSADPNVVGTILRELSTLSPVRTIADTVENLSEYGLENPSASITVNQGLGKPLTLMLGDPNPSRTAYYAVDGATRRVFLIPSQINDNLRKTSDMLRNRTLFELDRDKVNEIILTKNDYQIVIRMDSFGTWRVEEPYRLPAERDEVLNALNTIGGASVVTFVEEEPKTLRRYGLTNPKLTATLKSMDGSINHTLSLGNVENGRVFATTNKRKNVYAISLSVLEQLDRGADSYRRNTAFGFQSYRVPTLKVKMGEDSVTLVKKAFEDWRMMEPFKLRANDRLITALLDSLEIMRIQRYIPLTEANKVQFGLDSPIATLSLTIEDQINIQQILIGDNSEDGKYTYISDPGEEWIYAVRKSVIQELPSSAMEFKDNKILRFKGYQVHMFEIVTPEERLRVRRDQKERVVWKMEEPITGDADAISVGRAFSELDSLYSEGFITAEPEADLSPYGLDRPYMELTLQVGGRDDVPEERISLLIGKPFSSDRRLVYVKQRNSPVVSLAKAGFVARLQNMIAQTPKS